MAFLHSFKRDYGCAVFVCEELVSATVYEKLPTFHARVFYSRSMHIPRQRGSQDRQLGSLISSAVHQLFQEFELEMRKKGRNDINVKDISVFYAPPLSFSATEEIFSHSNKKEKLTEHFLASLFRDAEQSFLGRLKTGNVRMEDILSRYTVIERRVHRSALEGYPVGEYLGRSFQHFSAMVSFSAVPSLLIQKVVDACHSIFRSSEICHYSVAYSVSDTVIELRSQEKNVLVCTILPRSSLLTYVQGATPLTHLIFDGGEEHIIANVSHSLSVTKQVARSYGKLYLAGKLHGQSETDFINALRRSLDLWLKGMASAYQSIGELFMVPKTIFIIPSGDIGELAFRQIVSLNQYQGYLMNVLGVTHFPKVEYSENVSLNTLETILANRTLSRGGIPKD